MSAGESRVLTLSHANDIIDLGFQRAGELGVPPLTIVVLDPGGHLVAAQRQDGSGMFRFDVALGKAWAAVAMGASSRSLAKRAKDNPNFFLSLAATSHGRFLPQPGAALIRDETGSILGAVGASGGTGDQDEACSAFGIEQVGFVADVSE